MRLRAASRGLKDWGTGMRARKGAQGELMTEGAIFVRAESNLHLR